MPACPRCGRELQEGESRCPSCDRRSDPPARLDDEDTLILRLLEEGRPASEKSGVACLWLIDPRGGQIERTCELSGPVTLVGRTGNCDLCLGSSTVSRRHAELRREGDTYFVRDLNSTNGTLLNGEPVLGEEQLRDWDEIGVGIFKLIFRQE